jgi:hypothetical protein
MGAIGMEGRFGPSFIGAEVDIPCPGGLDAFPLCVFEYKELEPLIPPHERADWAEIDRLCPFLREGVRA